MSNKYFVLLYFVYKFNNNKVRKINYRNIYIEIILFVPFYYIRVCVYVRDCILSTFVTQQSAPITNNCTSVNLAIFIRKTSQRSDWLIDAIICVVVTSFRLIYSTWFFLDEAVLSFKFSRNYF